MEKGIMNKAGIAIRFFRPDQVNDISNGILYLEEGAKPFFEFEGSFVDVLQAFPVVYANSGEEEKFTFINCSFLHTMGGMCRFSIKELYKGDHISKVTVKDCFEVRVRMTGLTNWMNHPRIKPEITFSADMGSRVMTKGEFKKQFEISPDVTLELCEYCFEQYAPNQTVLQNRSYFKIHVNKAHSRMELQKFAMAFLRFLSLFTVRVPKLTSMSFTYSDESTADLFITNRGIHLDNINAILTFDKLELFLPEIFRVFFESRDKFSSVIKLSIESIINNTPEISFLNITAGFEVFHTKFLEARSASHLTDLYNELYNAGLVNRKPSWNQIIRYCHLFKLAEKFDFYKQDFPDPLSSLDIMRESRNYYTHYGNLKKRIWTPDELLVVNRSLRQILNAAILLELKIPTELCNKILNYRFDYVDQDFESNEYSLEYIKK